MFHHVMNFMSSMVGPMGGHTVQGMRAGQSATGGMGIATGGPALSDAYGASMGRSMGEMTGLERAVGNMTVMPPLTGNSAMPGMSLARGRSGMAGMLGMAMPTDNPPHAGHGGHGAMMGGRPTERVPGYPQGMMDMPMAMTDEELGKLTAKRETRGMRRDWYTGLQGLMTVVRVLPPDLYDRVMSGDATIPDGASIPGCGPAGPALHEHHH
jgi:hypothetical protein